MPTVVPLDELEAVNELLASIGQAPVSTLASASAIADVGLARSFLRGVVRAVQLHGFDFNTDRNYVLTPDVDGYLRVPDGVLRIKPVKTVGASLKRRRHPNGFWAIWDADNQTWTHTAPVEFDVVWAFDFDALPDVARHYVTVAAGRKFQMRTIGANSLDGYNEQDEATAWNLLLREERANRRTNLFRQNTTIAGQTNNRRY